MSDAVKAFKLGWHACRREALAQCSPVNGAGLGEWNKALIHCRDGIREIEPLDEELAALAAADKAREVTDEEVAKILRRFFSHFHGAMPDAVAQEAVAALHAAGMKVVRHEQ